MDAVARLIIPSTDDSVIGPIIDKVTRRFGGATCWSAFGTYVRSDYGTIDAEQVTVLEVGLTRTVGCFHRHEEWDFLADLARELCHKLDQECVYLSVRSETVQLIGP
jgi:hypothetical protein